MLTGIRSDMLVMREETFGPVAPLMKFDTEDEVIRLANATEFGLAELLLQRATCGRVWRVAEALESGIVGINEGIISTEVAPFGGVKESGIGREGSKYGLEEYLEIKYLCYGGVSMKASVRWVQDVMFLGESGSGHAVVMDGAPDAGGRNLGVRPMEMLLLGLGGCTAFDVVMILKRGREPVTELRRRAWTRERAETEPKVFTQHRDALSSSAAAGSIRRKSSAP